MCLANQTQTPGYNYTSVGMARSHVYGAHGAWGERIDADSDGSVLSVGAAASGRTLMLF
jgi:hypothetical protein